MIAPGDLQRLVEQGAELTSRGLSPGKTGNISVRTADLIGITPTGAVLGRMTADDIAIVTENGQIDGNPPSKELAMHQAMYRAHPDCSAIVHLHSLHAVAVSCLSDIDPLDPLPRVTPYFEMKVPNIRLVDYYRPGTAELADAVGYAAPGYRCLLLRNHGSLVAAPTLEEAADVADEIEQTAALALLLHGRAVNYVPVQTVNAIGRRC